MKLPAIKGFDEEAFNKYFKNTGWLMLARVGSLVIKILAGFAITNYLGKNQNGILNYPTAFTTFFVAAAALGLDGFTTRELLRTPENRDRLLGTAFWLKLLGGIAIVPLIYFAYTFWNANRPIETPLVYVLIVGLTGITQAFYITDSYFQSKVQAKYVMRVQVFGNIISAIIKLIFIFLKLSVGWFVFALLLDTIILATGYIYFYRIKVGSIFKWVFDSTLAKYLIKHSWPLALSAVLVSIYMKIDQLMVENYLGTGALGIYSTVVQLSESWYFIPVAIVTSVFPAIMNAKRDNPERYIKRLQNMYDLMVWISLSVAIFMTFASPIIYRIVYTPEFWDGAHVLTVHVWAGIFVFLGSASGQYLIAEGYTKLSMLRTGMGALANIILNILWIPKYGIMGAALATLIAYFIATFFILLIPKTRQQGIMMLKSLLLVTAFQKIFKR
ncbi:flippase [Pedobacter sp. HDW13]|uniref:flippase n=1 Tax=unclassified Pedobacter TaxID=2628915 RepID=UPI000F59BDCE|nr:MULTISPECIES: flippase [unclassified Pedobacter]QIL39257.1 flippase [Pedobacter sp. HDW13]RQO65651.1 flippase [Pedobacter sp. KBW01]